MKNTVKIKMRSFPRSAIHKTCERKQSSLEDYKGSIVLREILVSFPLRRQRECSKKVFRRQCFCWLTTKIPWSHDEKIRILESSLQQLTGATDRGKGTHMISGVPMVTDDIGFLVYWIDVLPSEIKEIRLNGLKAYLEFTYTYAFIIFAYISHVCAKSL